MTVKVGEQKSEKRPVNAGAPHGSVLGCYLFNTGVDYIKEDCIYNDIVLEHEHMTNEADSPTMSTPSRLTLSISAMLFSPVPGDPLRGVQFLPRAANVPYWTLKPKDKK